MRISGRTRPEETGLPQRSHEACAGRSAQGAIRQAWHRMPRLRPAQVLLDLEKLGYSQIRPFDPEWLKPDDLPPSRDPLAAMGEIARANEPDDPSRPRKGQYREITSAMTHTKSGPGHSGSIHGVGSFSFQVGPEAPDIHGGNVELRGRLRCQQSTRANIFSWTSSKRTSATTWRSCRGMPGIPRPERLESREATPAATPA